MGPKQKSQLLFVQISDNICAWNQNKIFRISDIVQKCLIDKRFGIRTVINSLKSIIVWISDTLFVLNTYVNYVMLNAFKMQCVPSSFKLAHSEYTYILSELCLTTQLSHRLKTAWWYSVLCCPIVTMLHSENRSRNGSKICQTRMKSLRDGSSSRYH